MYQKHHRCFLLHTKQSNPEIKSQDITKNYLYQNNLPLYLNHPRNNVDNKHTYLCKYV